MKDFKINFIHLCDEAIFSQDGKLSLIGIFDVVNLVALPGSLAKAFLVFNITTPKKLKEISLDISIKEVSTGKEVLKLPGINPSLKDKPEDSALGITLQLVNITFSSIGKHLLEIRVNNELAGSLYFDVKLLEKKGENK